MPALASCCGEWWGSRKQPQRSSGRPVGGGAASGAVTVAAPAPPPAPCTATAAAGAGRGCRPLKYLPLSLEVCCCDLTRSSGAQLRVVREGGATAAAGAATSPPGHRCIHACATCVVPPSPGDLPWGLYDSIASVSQASSAHWTVDGIGRRGGGRPRLAWWLLDFALLALPSWTLSRDRTRIFGPQVFARST